jgi:hypothetical protein
MLLGWLQPGYKPSIEFLIDRSELVLDARQLGFDRATPLTAAAAGVAAADGATFLRLSPRHAEWCCGII